jgi:hypothetical protein
MKVHLVDDKLLWLHYCRFHIVDHEGETVNTRRLDVKRMRISNEEKNNLGLAQSSEESEDHNAHKETWAQKRPWKRVFWLNY